MDIRQLEAFVDTVKYKSFSEAAKRLFLSQPTISAHVRALEKELNTKLINRTTKGFEITESGKRLFVYAQRIVELKERAEEELKSPSGEILNIGSSSVPAISVLPKYMALLKKASPSLCMRVTVSDSIDIIEKLCDGVVEIGLVGARDKLSECSFIPFEKDELVIVAPNTPYYKEIISGDSPVEKLLREPFIMREDRSGTKLETESFLSEAGYSMSDLNITAYINNSTALCGCIGEGLGISVMSKKAVLSSESASRLLVCPIRKNSICRDLYIAYHKKRGLGASAIKLLTLMTAYDSEKKSSEEY